jgi:RNA polymerase sigma-70 factor (ECF subfamily)
MIPIVFLSLDTEEDRSKIIRIYEKYRGLMFYVAVNILKDHALAEDAVSDSIEKLINNIHKVGDVSCYKTRSLVVIIVKNTALNMLKKNKRADFLDPDDENAIADTSPTAADKMTSEEGFGSIVAVINSLPDTYRDAAILSVLHEHSHDDIAKMLDISYATAKMRVSRAKKAIRDKLERGGDGLG